MFFLEKNQFQIKISFSISCIYIIPSKKGLFLQENKDIFIKIKPKINEASDFKFWVFKMSFNQITLLENEGKKHGAESLQAAV